MNRLSVGDFIAKSKERSYAVAKEAGLDLADPDLLLRINQIAAAEAEAYIELLARMERTSLATQNN